MKKWRSVRIEATIIPSPATKLSDRGHVRAFSVSDGCIKISLSVIGARQIGLQLRGEPQLSTARLCTFKLPLYRNRPRNAARDAAPPRKGEPEFIPTKSGGRSERIRVLGLAAEGVAKKQRAQARCLRHRVVPQFLVTF
jgi:hypothetical protein